MRKLRPELLAPAGSLEAFFAALDAGADAVYCGLAEFSARAKAKNFSIDDMEKMTGYAHQAGRRLYVALNTLIKENELSRVSELLAFLRQLRVDAVIVQDLGVWRLAHEHFPTLALHASTQMAIHNAAGVRVLERLGFSRAVLARELSLDEIRAIRRQTAMELEHFVHGALCYSISGLCLFSSFLSGRSGNRGRCAQPCRRRFHYRQQPGYHFSTSDLCGLEWLDRLAAAGIGSLKIEGRMKGAEYVGRVVSAYRQLLDAPPSGRREALREAGERLALSYGRRTTRGFLGGKPAADITVASEKGVVGLLLGRVTMARGSVIGFTAGDRLHLGDQVRVQPANDDSGSLFVVREIRRDGRSVKVAGAGDLVVLPVPFPGRFQSGDAVYKVAGRRDYSLSEAACRRRLEAGGSGKIPAGRPNPAALPCPPAAAEVFRSEEAFLDVVVGGADELGILDRAGVARVILALSPENVAAICRTGRTKPALVERLVWDIPAIIYEEDWPAFRGVIRTLISRGFLAYRLNNPAHFHLLDGIAAELRLSAGWRLYVLNSQAVLALKGLGAAEVSLSIEDDRCNLRTLLARDNGLDICVTVYGPLPLFTSRIPLPGVRKGAFLRTDSDEGFRVGYRDGLTVVAAKQDFSLLHRLEEIRAWGPARLIVDLSAVGAFSRRGEEVLAAVAATGKLMGSTEFNFERGLR